MANRELNHNIILSKQLLRAHLRTVGENKSSLCAMIYVIRLDSVLQAQREFAGRSQ